MGIKERLNRIRFSLPQGTVLVAVSKRKPVRDIREAIEAGHRDFGENRAEELVEKATALPGDITWHFIGHLQSKKAKLVVPCASLIHSVDSVKLLEIINKRAQLIGKVQDVLLQVHIAEEVNKFGFDPEALATILNGGIWKSLENINIRGLMGMATNTSGMAKVRHEFGTLKQLLDQYRTIFGEDPICSMGMSHDYREAIAQGSNMIRIGSAIFGPGK